MATLEHDISLQKKKQVNLINHHKIILWTKILQNKTINIF